MPINHIFSFLTFPHRDKPEGAAIPGAALPIDNGKLCGMLGGIFARAAEECTIPVMFTSHGPKQENPVRSELIALLAKPSIKLAQPLAARLQAATTGASGMGLLFVCIGKEGKGSRAVISRFPADEGVVAEPTQRTLSVEFVDQVFMKSAHAYKAVTYLYDGKGSDAWSGHAVDKQINLGAKAMARYWIVNFLMSDFKTTAAAGTKRLALALKRASKESSDPSLKAEIAAAVQLAGNLSANAMSIDGFCQTFQMSQAARELVASKVEPPRLAHEQFQFDKEEFALHIRYKQVDLDNGAALIAPVEKFDEVFKTSEKNGKTSFLTTGSVVETRLRKAK